MEIIFNEVEMELSHKRVIFCKKWSAVLLSDIHFGKTRHFKSENGYIPEGNVEEDISKINDVINFYKPQNLFILGDFVHSSFANNEELMEKVSSSLKKFDQLNKVLIEGNHDEKSNINYFDFGFDEVQKSMEIDSILLNHKPLEDSEQYTICGHIHPSVKIKDKVLGSFKLRCFFNHDNTLILPAFGSFTGTKVVSKTKGTLIYPIIENKVYKI